MLIGVYPQDTQTIEIEGVKFLFSLLPPSIHRKIQSKLAQFKGMNEDEIVKSGKIDELLEAYENTVRWAVKSHENFKDATGSAVEFSTQVDSLSGVEHKVVSKKLLDIYYYSGVTNLLGPQIFEKCSLSGQDSKNSDGQSA